MRTFSLIALCGLVLGGCPEPEPEVPAVQGTYPVTVAVVDGDCYPDNLTIFADSFVTWMGGDGTYGEVELVQQGSDISVFFGECEFFGTLDVEGDFYFGGECTTSAEGADIIVTSTGHAGPDEADNGHNRVEGTVLIEVDHQDEDGNQDPDGALDCSREADYSGREA